MPLPSTRQLGPCGPFPMAFGVQTHSLQSPRDTQSIGLTSDTDSSSTAYRTGEEPRHDSRHEVVLPDSAHSQGSLTATALPEPQYAAGVRFERHDDDILGNGTFSTVFAGTYDGERVAVKCHKAGWRTRERYASGRSTDLRSRVAEEVQKLCSMNHGCIVRVMGVHSPPNEVPWIIMEALDMTLKERCRMQPPLQTREHLSIAYDLAMALSHMRNKKLLHRDLNPSNAMLIRKGGVHRCVVADLGSARSIDNNHEWWCLPLLSESGLYVAPEAQVSSDHCDVGSTAYGYPSDVYSVGVTILELISVTPITVTSKQQGYSVQLSEAASHPLHATLVKCLSTSPHDRPTAHALMRDIGEIHRGDFRELEDSVVAVSFPVSKMQNEYASSLAINRVAKGSIANGSPNKEFIHKIAMYHLRELLPTRWWKAGELREDVSLTSGNPCVHQGFVYRSAKVQGRQAGVLLRAPIDNLTEAAWRDFHLPLCPGGNVWSKRIYTFSLGSWLYSILTVHTPEKSDRPPPSIYRIDTDDAQLVWRHVIKFRSKRVHFGAQLIRNHLVVVGGRHFSPGAGQPGPELRSAEFVTLNEGEGKTPCVWRSLPSLPTSCQLCRIVAYNGNICILGTNYHQHGHELTVLTLDLAVLEQSHRVTQNVTNGESNIELPSQSSHQSPPTANRPLDASSAAYESSSSEPVAGNASPTIELEAACSAEPVASRGAVWDETSHPSSTPTWQTDQMCSIPQERCAAAVINGVLVIAGGRTQLGAMSRNCYVYNELTNEWVQFSTGLSSPREFARLLVVSDSLVCLGGRSSRSHCDRDVEKLSLPHLNNSN
eukprot:scpid43465/ scgid0110/ Serine/threonine-protein kinase pknB &gt; Serine/threonine-protein kinase pknB